MTPRLAPLLAGFALACVLVVLTGFGHYEAECVDTWQPQPVLTQTPTVIPFDFSKELIVDGNVRCYALNPRGATPAVSCVVVP